jgi:hypothetical protein
MEVPKPLANLVNYANSIDQGKSERIFTMSAMIIAPDEQIPLILPTGFARLALFGVNHSDDCRIKAQLQPGVYQNRVLPVKDNLFIEITEREGYTQVMYRFRAIPLHDSSAPMAANNTALADLSTKDDLNMVDVEFQLLDVGYAQLKTTTISDHLLMTTLDNALHYQLTKYGEQLQLTGGDKFRGVDIEYPYDNTRVFKQIVIPPMPLIKFAEFLQQDDQFGFYSRGMASYYRKGMWYIFPPLKIGRYEAARKVANIYALPSNVFPTLKNSWFLDDKVLTILSTGEGHNSDGSDIQKQNFGSGKRVVSSDAIMGETGSYYAKGQALTTREDSMSEYKTTARGSGEDSIPFHATPTNNLCKLLSQNAYIDGSVVSRTWHNSRASEITPGMPCRFYFMSGSDALMYREGTIITVRSEYQQDTQNAGQPKFREHSTLELFLANTVIPVDQ